MIRLILLPAFFMLIGAACDGNGSDAARTEDAAERTGTSSAGSGAASSFAWLNDPSSRIGDQEMTEQDNRYPDHRTGGSRACDRAPRRTLAWTRTRRGVRVYL